MSLPPPREGKGTRRTDRHVVAAAVLGGGICLFAVIVGLILLGLDHENEVTDTGLASIGATLAGGFAGWIARDSIDRRDRD